MYVLTVHILQTCIAARGRFVVAVSGGSIPPILRQISAGIASEGTVERWRFVFADERCVSIDHPDSNFGIWKREIFDNIAGFDLVRNVLHIERWENSQECAGDYQSRLGTFLGMPGDMGASPGALIDLVVLGMGPDGHTASLFPDHALVARSSGRRTCYELIHVIAGAKRYSFTSLSEAETMIVSIDESPKPPPRRITFSLAALNDAVEACYVCRLCHSSLA